MSAEEFLEIIDSLVKIYKKRESKSKYEREKAAEYYPGYDDFVQKYEKAKIQAFGLFPEKLFKSIAPMQSPEELAYIRENYESETKDVFTEFSTTVKKAVTNGTIEFPTVKDKQESNQLKDYLSNQITDFDNFSDYLDAMVDHKLIDANGIICVWPEEMEVDEDGIITGKIYPQPIIYAVPNVLWKKDGEFIVITSKRSKVQYGNQVVDEGLIFRYIGKEYWMQANQVGKKVDDTFDVVLELEHGIVDFNNKPWCPATYLK